MTENTEHQPWMDSPFVCTMIDYEDTDETGVDVSKIAWFDVKIDMGESEVEKREKIETMQEQIKLGILQPNGFPVGMAAPQGAFVPGAIKPNGGFNFPGAIGIPLPSKFNSTPVTRQLQAAATRQPTNIPRMVPGILPNMSLPPKGKDIFEKGADNLRRIQELTRDRRK